MTSQCREYRGYRNRDGYGYPNIGERRRDTGAKKSMLLHRWVMEQWLGRKLDRTEVVRHKCDNPACFLLDHLELGTQADNLADMHARGRRPYKLTLEQAREVIASDEPQRALAKRYGVSQDTIGQIKRGQRNYVCL